MCEPFEKSISKLGLAVIAKGLGVKLQVVQNWRSRGVPPRWCIPLESLTSGTEVPVTRYELRPDIFGSEAPKAAA